MQQAMIGFCNQVPACHQVPACLVGHSVKKDTRSVLAELTPGDKTAKHSDAGTAVRRLGMLVTSSPT